MKESRAGTFEQIKQVCSGPCVGVGMGHRLGQADRPAGGDPDTKRRVQEQAKAKAHEQSLATCDGELCLCVGDCRPLIPEQSVDVTDAQGKTACFYLAIDAYEGNCQMVI